MAAVQSFIVVPIKIVTNIQFLCDEWRGLRYANSMKLSIIQKRNLVSGVIVVLFMGLAALLLLAKADDRRAREAVATAREATLPLPSAVDLAATYGGVSANALQQAVLSRVGQHLSSQADVTKLRREFRFYLLADQTRNNVFALPDGTVFITSLLFNRLKTEGALAAMLAIEMAHVAARHEPLYQVNAILTYSPEQQAGAEVLAVHYMAQAGYDPRVLESTLGALDDLHSSTKLEFFTTHPNDGKRNQRIGKAIDREFPNGVPESLSK